MTAAFRVVCGCFCAIRMDPCGCDPDGVACRTQVLTLLFLEKKWSRLVPSLPGH